jgi:hypothetical protein
VTLTRADTPTGQQIKVPAGSELMSPGNRRNPDLTGLFGDFGWDVAPGYYRVTARKPGCGSVARTALLAIPPPITNLLLRLRCPGASRAGTRVRLHVVREGADTTVLRAGVSDARRAGDGPPQRDLAGTVTFRIGHTTVADVALDPATDTAVLVLPRSPAHGRFSATYSGDALFAPSQAVRR